MKWKIYSVIKTDAHNNFDLLRKIENELDKASREGWQFISMQELKREGEKAPFIAIICNKNEAP